MGCGVIDSGVPFQVSPRSRAIGLPCTQTFFGIQILRAGEHGAQVALAAVERGHASGPPGCEKPSDCMARCGSMGWPSRIARAELGAEAALVAGRAADLGDVDPWRVVAPDERVLGGQHDDAAGGLGDGHIEVGGGLGHHHAAEQHAEVGNRGAARGLNRLRQW